MSLKTELATDPLARGYSGFTDEQVVTDIMTEYREQNISSISGDDAFGATDGAEFAALTDTKKQLWLAWCGRDSIDPFQAANVAFVNWIYGAGSATITALAALRKRNISRAAELGLGSVKVGTVQEARS